MGHGKKAETSTTMLNALNTFEMRKKMKVSMDQTNSQRTKPHLGIECTRIKNKKKNQCCFQR